MLIWLYLKMKIISSLIKYFALTVNFIAILSLVLSYLVKFISPEKFWPIAFFGLTYPIILAVNILFVLYWLIQLKKEFLYSLIIILLGWNYLTKIFQINFNSDKKLYTESQQKSFKIITYNVKTFSAYPWSNWGVDAKKNIFNLLNEENADVICLQEFNTGFEKDSPNQRGFYNLDTLVKILKTNFYHYEETYVYKHVSHFGLITLSKYPIVNKGVIVFSNSKNNRCIYSDIKIKDDIIRTYNIHLQSIHFDYPDYDLLDSIKQNNNIQLSQLKKIISLLKKAYIKRSAQVQLIAEHTDKSSYPTIICGDFNDTPISYAYFTLYDNFNDAFEISGTGFGSTYAGKIPCLRIDYVFFNKNLNVSEYKIIQEAFSDHYPVSCIMKIEN